MLYTVWFINSANHRFNFSQMDNECTTSHLLYFSCTLQTNVYVRPLPRFHSCFVFDALFSCTEINQRKDDKKFSSSFLCSATSGQTLDN